jgi:hypothetical protein
LVSIKKKRYLRNAIERAIRKIARGSKYFIEYVVEIGTTFVNNCILGSESMVFGHVVL